MGASLRFRPPPPDDAAPIGDDFHADPDGPMWGA